MLSKLRHYAFGKCERPLDCGLADGRLAQLLHEQKISASHIKRIVGGTLGLTYSLQIDERPMVLKTHLTLEGCQNIEKEIALLHLLYADASDVRRVVLVDDQQVRVSLLMDAFKYPQHEFEPDQIRGLTTWYTAEFKQVGKLGVVAPEDTLSTLFVEGVASLARLYANHAISQFTHTEVEKNFSILAAQLDRLPVALCHGDLGPQNIMCQRDAVPVVIDWEDAFWGVEGYDYLYWLTFLSSRKYYVQDLLGNTPLGKETEIAILVLIVVLKSELSCRIDPHMHRQLSFDQRIAEILALK